MQILKEITTRRAFRALDTRSIDHDVLIRLANAAHLAPSSGNNQPWRMVTVVDDAQLEALKGTLSAGNYWARKAPAIVAFITDADWSLRLGDRDYAYFELGMAAMAYQIQAVGEGLYVHPIAGFNAEEAKQVLGLPANHVLEVLMVLGYPGDVESLNAKHQESERSERIRKPLDEVSAFNVWEGGERRFQELHTQNTQK
jgi:nitroreductase